jgi:hypothetical protein
MILWDLCGEHAGLFRLLSIVKVDSLVNVGSVVSVFGSGHDFGVCFGKMVKVAVVIEDLIVLDTPYFQFNGFGPEYVSDLLDLLFSIELVVTPDNLLLKILQLLYSFLLQPYDIADSLLLIISFPYNQHFTLLDLCRSIRKKGNSGCLWVLNQRLVQVLLFDLEGIHRVE